MRHGKWSGPGGTVMTPERRPLPPIVCFIMMYYVSRALRKHFFFPLYLCSVLELGKKTCLFTSGVVNRLYITRICCDVCAAKTDPSPASCKDPPARTFCNNVLQLSRSIMHSFPDAGTKRSVISLTENDSLISEMYSVLVAKWGCLLSSPCRSGKLHTLVLWDRAL